MALIPQRRLNNILNHLILLAPAPQPQKQQQKEAKDHKSIGAVLAASGSPWQSAVFASATAATAALKFTHGTNGSLTQDQRVFYEKNGFIVFKRLFDMDELDVWAKRFVAIANGEIERSFFMTVMRDITLAKQKGVSGEKFIVKLNDFHNDPVLWEYIRSEKMLRIVSGIIGDGGLTAIHNMLINKPPDVGVGSSRHPLHQDLWYFPHRPSERIVATWTAMQDIDEKNGCLVVDPGTHKGELFMHEYPKDGVVNKAYHGIQGKTEADMKNLIPLIMEPGDTVFFHPLLHHGSGRNNTTGYRKAISCHYAHNSCHIIDMDNTMQQSIKDEMMQLGAKKRGRPFTFEEWAQLKYRPVK
jgi:phytanoyl-CoA hydroxylase